MYEIKQIFISPMKKWKKFETKNLFLKIFYFTIFESIEIKLDI